MTRTRMIRLLVAAAVMAAAGLLLAGYTTDDTWIHLRYARNLLDHGEFSFNPGDRTYGGTSPLWIFFLAGLLKLGLGPEAAARTAGILSGLLVLALLDPIVTRMSFRRFWKGVLLVAIVVDAWFLRWTFSGMETPLATAMLLVLVWPLFSARDMAWGTAREPLWRRYLAWGAAAGLAGLVRPEFMVLAPLALPWLLWFEYNRAGSRGDASARWRARPHAPLVAAAVGWLAVAGPWLVYAKLTFGRFTPGTAAAKSAAISLAPDVLAAGVLQSLRQLAATQGAAWLALLVLGFLVFLRNQRFARLGEPDGWQPGDADEEDDELGPGVGPWSVWGPVALVGIAATWTVVLVGGYAAKQVWVISRYLSPLVPIQLLAMAVTAEWLMTGSSVPRARRGRCRKALYLGFAGHLLLNAWIFGAWVVPHAQAFPDGLRTCYGGMGRWLHDHTPENAVVAALDIGAVGWFSERHVLDLMGLVSPQVMELGHRLGFAEMVASGAWLDLPGQARPGWFVDRCEGEPRFAGREIDGVRFELVDSCTVQGVGLREPQPWTVALYRLVSTGS